MQGSAATQGSLRVREPPRRRAPLPLSRSADAALAALPAPPRPPDAPPAFPLPQGEN